ncbi:ATP-binding protein [Pontiellaceae bacterium B12227]|nr:ATP-binding protein [Pontiellaceae bacterium B12227]
MNLRRILFLLAVLLSSTHAQGTGQPNPYADLKEEIETTRIRLDELPLRLIRESGGTLGFEATRKGDGAWLAVDLLETRTFDTIMLIPSVQISESKESTNYGFPDRLQVRTYADAKDKTGQLLFDSATAPIEPLPNQSPVIIDCPGTSARQIRIIAHGLPNFREAPLNVFSVSEVLVFDGNRNLALGKPVTGASSTEHRPLWGREYLTDGYMPFSQPCSREFTDGSYCRIHVPPESRFPASITLDLGREYPLDEIHLYPVHVGDNFAVFHKTALGFPRQFRIEVSNDAAFSSPTVIFNSSAKDYPSPGHRLACFAANNASGRYVRITATKLPPHPQSEGSIFAFAEIEVIAEGAVVSRGAKISLSYKHEASRFVPAKLVDGMSSIGRTLPIREWLTDLSERNRLEVKLEALQAELQHRYIRQSRIIRNLGWSITLIFLFSVVLVLLQRLTRLRQIYRLRENLAADLHDEIGGTFSGIALMSDELAHEEDMPETHIPQLSAIADISRTSANNTRSLVRFLESRGVTGELLEKMQEMAKLMLAEHVSKFDIEGEKHIAKLAPKEKWHLLLFFKEALTNIVKHANASEVSIRLQLAAQRLTLTISDDGKGLGNTGGRQPTHLAMRAQKLKAKLNLSTPPGGGTAITLEKKL